MSPKEKAKELTNRMYDGYGDNAWDMAKERAVICADKHLRLLSSVNSTSANIYGLTKYWTEVKEHIKDL